MVLSCCLTVGVTGGDLDHAPVRHDHGLEEAQRAAVFSRQELHRDFVALVEGIRAGLSNASLGEGRRGAESQNPLGVRAVRIFDVETERAVGVRKFDLRDFSLQLELMTSLAS